MIRHPRLLARRNTGGFTLIELMIVLALVVILSTAGIIISRDVIPRYRTRSAALTFAAKANECRAQAVRANRECMIWMKDYDSSLADPAGNVGEYWVALGDASSGSTTWDYLPAEKAGSTGDDTSEGMVDLSDNTGNFYKRHVALDQWPSLNGPGVGNSDRIVFSPKGWLSNPAADFDGSGQITLRFVNKIARYQGRNEDYTVSISRAGMVRVDSFAENKYDGLSAGTETTSGY